MPGHYFSCVDEKGFCMLSFPQNLRNGRGEQGHDDFKEGRSKFCAWHYFCRKTRRLTSEEYITRGPFPHKMPNCSSAHMHPPPLFFLLFNVVTLICQGFGTKLTNHNGQSWSLIIVCYVRTYYPFCTFKGLYLSPLKTHNVAILLKLSSAGLRDYIEDRCMPWVPGEKMGYKCNKKNKII